MSSSEESIPEILVRIPDQLTDLIRSEFKLARAEMTETAKRSGQAAGLMSAGGFLAAFGFAALLATLILLLALVVPAWAAAGIVTAVLFLAALIAVLVGRNRIKQVSVAPQRAVDNVKQDVEQIKEGAHHDNS
ncbi:phage holin family protein [Acidipropionibacterium thoenii]|uniref:phage holin family protein n=1 Tax=Acidipropionibacterium thoenii TaxID=1751 RepID=UPI0004181CC8|nr:phage holin family protein [Acidipropionibacterium thoenii]